MEAASEASRTPSRAVKTLFGLDHSSPSVATVEASLQYEDYRPRSRGDADGASSRRSAASSRGPRDASPHVGRRPRSTPQRAPWYPPSSRGVAAASAGRGGGGRAPRPLSFSVESLQKDHAIIVDQVIEQLTRGNALSVASLSLAEPAKFAAIYEKLQSELERVLYVGAAEGGEGLSDGDLARAKDVQHIVSIVFSLVEHERSSFMFSMSSLRDTVRRREGRLAARAREELSVGMQRRLGAGARLLTALARNLVEERPARKAFGVWARHAAILTARNAALRTALAVDELRAARARCDDDAKRIADLERLLAREKGHADRNLSRLEAKRDEQLARVRSRWLRRTETAALHGWAAKARERRRLRGLAKRIFSRFSKNGESLAFSTWRSRAAALRDAARAKEARTIGLDRCRRRWLHMRTARSLGAWTDFVDERKRLRRLVKKCAARLAGHAVAPSFRSWIEFADAARRAEEAAAARQVAFDRAKARWLHAREAAVYRTWVGFVDERKRLRSLVKRTCANFRDAAVSRAWRGWRAFAAAAEAAELEVARRERLLDKVRRRWLMASAHAAFNSWESFARNRKRLRRLAARTATRMQHALVLPGFETWRTFVADGKKREVMLARVRKRWLDGFLHKAWGGWAHFVGERKRLRLLAVRAAAHVVHRVLAPGFGKWRRKVELLKDAELEALGDRADDLAARLQHGERELKKLLEQKARSKQASARGLFAAWAGKSLSRVWFAWLTAFRSRRERARDLEVRALRLLRHAFVAKSFRSWVFVRDMRRRARDLVNRTIRRFATSTVAPAFRSWVLYLRALDREIADERKRAVTLDRFRRRYLHATEARALAGWRAAATERKRLRALVTRSVRRIDGALGAPAFRSWVVFAEAQRRDDELALLREKAVDRCRRRLRNALAHKAFQGWVHGAGERSRLRKLVRKFVSRMSSTTRPLTLAVRQWALFVGAVKREEMEARFAEAEERRRARLLDKMRRRMRNATAHRAYQAWVAMWTERRRLRALVSRTVARLRGGALAPALRAWWLRVAAAKKEETDARRRDVLLDRVRRRLKDALATRSFNAWTAMVRERKRLRSLVKRTAGRFLAAEAAPALRSWVLFVDAAKREEADAARKETILDQVRRRMLFATLHRSYNAWVHMATERRRLRSLVRRVLGNLANKETAKAFAKIRAEAREGRRHEAIVDRVRRRMVHGLAHRSFAGWASKVADKVRLRGTVTRILQHLLHSTLGPAFRTLAHHARERRRYEVLVKRAALKMLLATKAKALAGWRENAATRRRLRTLVTMALRRLTQGAAMKAWATWGKFVEAVRAATRFRLAADDASYAAAVRLALSLVARKKRCALIQGFTVWRRAAHAELRAALHDEVVQAGHTLDDARSRESRERERRALRLWTGGIMGRVVDAWRSAVKVWKRQRVVLFRYRCRWNAKLSFSAFGTWDRFARERRQARSVLKRVFHASAVGSLVGALRRWRAINEALRQALVSEKRHAAVVDRVRRRWLMRTSTKAFSSWTHFVHDRKRLRALSVKTIRRFEHATIFPAFSTWSAAMVHARHAERVLGAARQRMAHALAYKALNGWTHFVGERKRLRSLLAHAGGRFLHARLHPAFRSLLLHAQGGARRDAERRRQDLVVDRCRRRFLNQRIGRAYAAWTHMVQSRKRARQLVKQAARRFTGDACAPALGKWRLAVMELKFSEDEARRQALVVYRVRQKMVHGRASRALRSWTDFVRDVKWLRVLVRRVLARFAASNLAPAWRAWVLAARALRDREEREKRHAVVLDRCRRRFRNAAAARSWNAWAHFCADRKRLRALAKRIIGRFANSQTLPALNAWVAFVKECEAEAARLAKREVLLDRVRRRVRHHCAARALTTWQHFREERRVARLLCQRVLAKFERGGLAKGLRSWVEFAAVEREREELFRRHEVIVGRCRLRFLHLSLGRAFNGWTFHVHDRRRVRQLVRSVLGRMRSRLSSMAFGQWARAAEHLALEKERDVAAAARSAAQYWAHRNEARADQLLRRRAFSALASLRARRAAGRARAARWKQARGRGHRAACFRAWHSYRKARSLAKVPTLRAACRMLDVEATRMTRRGLNKWLRVVEYERVHEAHFQEDLDQRHERRKKALVAISVVAFRLQQKVFVAWVERHKHEKRFLRLKVYISHLFVHQVFIRTIGAWLRFGRVVRRERAAFSRVLKRRAAAAAAHAFAKWCAVAAGRPLERRGGGASADKWSSPARRLGRANAPPPPPVEATTPTADLSYAWASPRQPSIASTPATAHEPYFSSATMASALSHETLESPHFERTLARAAAGKENHHAYLESTLRD